MPKGLFVDSIIEAVRTEFKEECDYLKEADKLSKYRRLLDGDPRYYVPKVYKKHSNSQCLCMEFVAGQSIDSLADEGTPQEVRDYVGSLLLELCLRELFVFRFMQTDPNPANFFYNPENKKLVLIDLGAGRGFDKYFVDNYMGIVHGASENDIKKILECSKNIGVVTGEESKRTLQAHINAALIIGEGFSMKGEPFYDFSTQDVTNKVS